MSLLKLLAAGRSLIGTREPVTPYRMRTANLLPKFGSPKNPFAPAPKSEPASPVSAATPAAAAAPAKPVAAKVEPVKMETLSLFESKPAAPATPVPAKVVEAKPELPKPAVAAPIQSKPAIAATVKPAAKQVSWAERVKKLNPLQYLPALGAGVKKSPMPRGARTPVQTELSLEKVKVVRNDLSDTDLEVVPAQPVGLPKSAGPMIQSMNRTETTNWNQTASRLEGVGENTMIH